MRAAATYYDVLGVSPTSNQQEIKAAYRRLALKSHPDRGGDPALFNLVQQAYECLSDPRRRREYDQQYLLENERAQAGSSTGPAQARATYSPPPPPRPQGARPSPPPPSGATYYYPPRPASSGVRLSRTPRWVVWVQRRRPPGLHHRWYWHLGWWAPGLATWAWLAVFWSRQHTWSAHWPGILVRFPNAPAFALLVLVLPATLASMAAGGLLLRRRWRRAILAWVAINAMFSVIALWALGPLLAGLVGLVVLGLLSLVLAG